MKKLHLLCNAHLDPVWLWRWNEGLAEAISTFRVAADFCEQYDGFVFNHNEALLYEWVEEHEPALFARIQKLVKEGKWAIMGGWYLQPDCTMPSGESFLEQIKLGQEYFQEKFGVTPTTAINFDPFGHSRGLVQIMKKTGYDGYIFMRPYKYAGDFVWEGFDGSQILAHCITGGYLSLKGDALNKIKRLMEAHPDKDIDLCLWGIGNHGGGPSRIDLENIQEFIKESDLEVIHSTAEGYIAEITQNKENLPVIATSLCPAHVGCYTSMVRIKQANRRLENKLAMTEKIISYADITCDVDFDMNELKKAKKALAFCQFHDILPGSSIKTVEDDSLRTFAYGEEIADRLYTKAFFKLCEGQPKANEGEIPILVFNPHPYEIEGEFEVEFLLQNQNWNEGEQTLAIVYDAEGNRLPCQNEKPQATFNLDWIEKVSFTGKLAPSSVTRFDCKLTTVHKDTLPAVDSGDEIITITNDRMTVSISRKTGLIEQYIVDGKTYIENSGKIEVYKDSEDPWSMRVYAFKEKLGEFTLMSDEETNDFLGYPEETFSNVRVVENGEVRTKVQAFFSYKRSVAMVEYTIPKNSAYIDVNITMYSNEPNKMLKYTLNTKLNGTPYGETAFGRDTLFLEEKESVFHKWCGIYESEDAGAQLYVINNGLYGGSFTESSIKLSLLRTPVYATHPIQQRQVAPHDRFLNHIDMGERYFSFRITTEKNIEREAQIYNEAPQLLSFFPSGEGEAKNSVIQIDNPDVILSSFRKEKDGYELVLHNFSEYENDAMVYIPALEKNLELHFGKYELKTVNI